MLAIYNWGPIDSMNRMFGMGDRPSPRQSAGPMFHDYVANSKVVTFEIIILYDINIIKKKKKNLI